MLHTSYSKVPEVGKSGLVGTIGPPLPEGVPMLGPFVNQVLHDFVSRPDGEWVGLAPLGLHLLNSCFFHFSHRPLFSSATSCTVLFIQVASVDF